MRHSFLILVAALAMVLASCSETKYVPEGEYLLDKTVVKLDSKNRMVDVSALKPLVRQRGNSRWFSAAKLPLVTYSLSGRDTTKWINRVLRSMGEAPQLYDSASTLQSRQNLQTQLQNMGFLRAEVDVDVKVKGKKLITTYLLHPGDPYFIRKVNYEIHDPSIAALINAVDSTRKGLSPGMVLNIDNLDNERKRITQFLTNRGYYRFN